ncbi:MAG: hypothetical protein JWR34_5185 [Mycobacterium sp.]|nr:hypothetical protein [Mycobacterium sp.]
MVYWTTKRVPLTVSVLLRPLGDVPQTGSIAVVERSPFRLSRRQWATARVDNRAAVGGADDGTTRQADDDLQSVGRARVGVVDEELMPAREIASQPRLTTLAADAGSLRPPS